MRITGKERFPAGDGINGGFSLVEVLAAMGILAVLVLLLGSMFDQASRAWLRGESQVIIHDLGRSLGERLTRDAYASIADDLLPFAVNNDFAIEDSSTPIESGFGTAPLLVGACDALYMCASVGQRNEGDEVKDIHEVSYFVDIDTNGVGRLARRGFNVSEFDFGESFRYIQGYKENMSRGTYPGIFADDNFVQLHVPDRDVELVLENVYSFEVMAFDTNGLEVADYYSKSTGNKQPARLDVRFVLLSDDAWKKKDAFSAADWHAFAQEQGKVFAYSMAFPTRGR